jgi:hypothetical protein
MEFVALYIDKEERFSLGRETLSEKFYLAIPVSSSLVDYEEYYEITATQFERFQRDANAAREFVGQCRDRKLDHLLLVGPGKNRGVAG